LLKLFLKLLVELTGNPLSSRCLRFIAESRGSAFLNRLFVKTFAVKMEEAESSLHEYKSLQSLFVRKLKPGIRPIDPRPNALVSPVDGILSAYGRITQDSTFLVKGDLYRLRDVLGKEDAEHRYQNGHYFVIYLSPGHYHRIHSPANGAILEQWHLGRTSYPVNRLGMKYGGHPFSKNYRLISEMATPYGNIAVIKIGALNVNSIHLTHATSVLTKGEEIGYFSFGSTVILFTETADFRYVQTLVEGKSLRYGEPLGCFTAFVPLSCGGGCTKSRG